MTAFPASIADLPTCKESFSDPLGDDNGIAFLWCAYTPKKWSTGSDVQDTWVFATISLLSLPSDSFRDTRLILARTFKFDVRFAYYSFLSG